MICVNILSKLGAILDSGKIPYQFTGPAALKLQGVKIEGPDDIALTVQWDIFDQVHQLFQPYQPSTIKRDVQKAVFTLDFEGKRVWVSCLFNMTIRTDPYRISVNLAGKELWCRSLYSYLYDSEMTEYSKEIHEYLFREQKGLTENNEQAWNQNNYTALINRYGEPATVAEKIKQNPIWRLHPFYKYLGNVSGKKITHLMGSNGVKAIALSLLGAEVAVIDFSKENAMFAEEMSKSAGVSIEYLVSDILSIDENNLKADQDIVLMELGVLHYLIDLEPLMKIITAVLKQGGRFVLHEFHPISTKLITSAGKKHKVTGNYFDPSLERNEVAFTKHLPDAEKENLVQVVQRKWTIGEVVTAIGQTGLLIKVLEEEPNHKLHDIGLPKTYTLVAEKQ